MNRFPRISVVIPSFNQSAFLRECLNSVCDQEYPNLEVIVMDGGSTDESLEVLEEFRSHLFFFQSQPDGGQVAALNRGLFEIASGEILTWLNSDDYWATNILAE